MQRLENLLGAQSLAVADQLLAASVEAGSRASESECAALVTLLAHPGRTVGWLGAVLELTSSGVTRLVGRLDAAGWVVRSAGDDARHRRLRLTSTGRRRARQILDARRAVLGQALAVLTSREQIQLEALLDKVITAMTDERVGALHICRLCDRSACSGVARACPLQHTVPDG